MNNSEAKRSLPSEPRTFGFHVSGNWMDGGHREVSVRHSPAHGVPVTQTPVCTVDDMNHAVSAVQSLRAD